jgi:DHA2 family methylenomycin A resistance protein-like MFS transporter
MGAAAFGLFQPQSGYPALLPAFLGLGIGAGLFTAPVVSAAMAAVPGRSGLVGGINNTARQTGTALGIAAFGAVAGGTAAPDGFVHGMHVLAAVGTATWLGVAVLVGWTVRPMA